MFQSTLNAFMGLGRPAWTEARQTLQTVLSADKAVLRDDAALKQKYANTPPPPPPLNFLKGGV